MVAVASNGERLHLDADEVVICAGALQSPALLMRAGIGSKHELGELGIGCLVDLPGVGRNLKTIRRSPSVIFSNRAFACHFPGVAQA